ncbi:MAG: type IV pilus modification protein PilV [Gammaproteobacteria bacterium]
MTRYTNIPFADPQLKRSCGFTLVEVMIASFILATGILAFITLQLQALNATRIAGLQTQAAILASDVADSARANLEGLIAGAYNISSGKASDLVSTTPLCSPCTPEQIAAIDINTWLQRVAEEITDSEISLQFTQPNFIISIKWPTPDNEPKTFALTTQVCAEETPRGGGTQCLL